MVDWFVGLNIFEKVLFVISVASAFMIIAKAFIVAIRFYGIDKLNSEPEMLENYEEIANNDSDIIKHTPRFLTIMGINVLTASFGCSYFVFKMFTQGVLNFLFASLIGVLAFVLYAVFDFLNKRNAIK